MLIILNDVEISAISGGTSEDSDIVVCGYNNRFLIDEFFNYKTGLPSLFGPPSNGLPLAGG